MTRTFQEMRMDEQRTPEAWREMVAAAEARGFARAREQACDSARIARPLENVTMSARDNVVFNMGVRAAVERIRAMTDERAEVTP